MFLPVSMLHRQVFVHICERATHGKYTLDLVLYIRRLPLCVCVFFGCMRGDVPFLGVERSLVVFVSRSCSTFV
jgi:hypothetical protein